MTKYLLLYHKDLRQSNELINGRLLLIDTSVPRILEKYIATSGSIGWQEPHEVWVRSRGALPESEQVGIDYYGCNTRPIALPNTKGVEGNFYQISPFSIQNKSDKNLSRSDFGIHFDANIPGSAGCIVIRNRPAWVAFENRMTGLRNKEGINQLPLLISYEK